MLLGLPCLFAATNTNTSSDPSMGAPLSTHIAVCGTILDHSSRSPEIPHPSQVQVLMNSRDAAVLWVEIKTSCSQSRKKKKKEMPHMCEALKREKIKAGLYLASSRTQTSGISGRPGPKNIDF